MSPTIKRSESYVALPEFARRCLMNLLTVLREFYSQHNAFKYNQLQQSARDVLDRLRLPQKFQRGWFYVVLERLASKGRDTNPG
jgi:hypothetical protein